MTKEPGAKHAALGLGKVISFIERTRELSSDISEPTDLPQAFPVVANNLATVNNTLVCMKEKLSSKGSDAKSETGDEKGTYPSIIEMTKEACTWADSLENLFHAVLTTDGSLNDKLDEYRSLAEQSGRIEVIMANFLRARIKVATVALVGDDLVASLQEALRQVREVPPSLEDERKGYVFTNSGSGNQFNQLGNGNINSNYGNGPMITGDASYATMNFNELQTMKS